MDELHMYILFMVIVFSILAFYNYKDRYYELIYKFKNEELNLQDYFFNDIQHLKRSSKRKIWIHIPNAKNARKWEHFGTRNSYDMNLDYIVLCIKSIIDYCGQYYDIILLDDSNLSTLLPEQSVDYTKLSGELLEKYRHYSLLKLLYTYGGILMPNSMYMRKSIYSIDKDNTFYVCEVVNQGESVSLGDFVYSTKITGSNKNNPILGNYINKYSDHCLKDLTHEHKYFSDQCLKKMDIPILSGKFIGTRDKYNKPIRLEDLMENKTIKLDSKHVGIYIPHEELMRRTKYNWFIYLTSEEVLETNVFISKYMLKHGKPKI
jgi:hypothetical protein